MSLSPRQVRAIAHHRNTHPQLRLSLQSRADRVYFTDKASGGTVIVTMKDLLSAYDEDRKEQARARRQEQKRQEAGR
jgi:hypothetical protein